MAALLKSCNLPATISDTDPLSGPDLGNFSGLTSSIVLFKQAGMLSIALGKAQSAADPDGELYTKMAEQD